MESMPLLVNYNDSYTILDQQMVEYNNGTTLIESIFATQLPVMLSFSTVAVSSFVFHALSIDNSRHFLIYLIEFVLFILPLTLLVTCISDYIYITYLLAFIFFVFFISAENLITNVKSALRNSSMTRNEVAQYPYITCFRSCVNIFSVICILAVDFNIFPRKYAKTEVKGYGLMDTGVGLYVISNALVYSKNKMYSIPCTLQSTCVKLKRILPLFILGVGRYCVLTSINYQQHVSEYGVHWNFFVTLAILKVINEILLPLVHLNIYGLIFVLFVIHQLSLSSGLEDWIISETTTRSNFISANREGIFSITGYQVLFLFGIIIQRFLPSKDDFIYKYVDTIKNLCIATVTFLTLTVLAEMNFGVSRRTVNCTYIFWLISISLLALTLTVCSELIFCSLVANGRQRYANTIPLIIKSVNYNGLIFFLLANLLTGLVNIFIETWNTNMLLSIIIMVIYMLLCTGIITFLYHKKVHIF